MIIVRMGLSVAWQNGSQNSSSLTTLKYNRQLARQLSLEVISFSQSE